MKSVPVMVNVCAAAPAVTEDGERPVMFGTGLDAGGVGELPPPPPQEEIKKRTECRRCKHGEDTCVSGFVKRPQSGCTHVSLLYQS